MMDRIIRISVDQIAKGYGIDPDSIFRVTVTDDTQLLVIEYQKED